jgi:hypothetical protein
MDYKNIYQDHNRKQEVQSRVSPRKPHSSLFHFPNNGRHTDTFAHARNPYANYPNTVHHFVLYYIGPFKEYFEYHVYHFWAVEPVRVRILGRGVLGVYTPPPP